MVFDDTLEDEIQITVIATGIDGDGSSTYGHRDKPDYTNVVKIRDVTPDEAEENWTVKMNGVNLDTPTFQRRDKGLSGNSEQDQVMADRKNMMGRLQLKDNLDYPTFLRAKAD